jgi:hypothetical protein
VIGFEDACLVAPVGVTLLAGLEARVRDGAGWFDMPPDSSPAAIETAVAAVRVMPFAELCSLALSSASCVGPWTGGAPEAAAAAYRWAQARRPIAAAIAERFDAELHAPMNPAGQQWWTSPGVGSRSLAPLFQRFSHVYDNGEFTLAGLWTVTDPPPETHDALVDAWELWPQPTSRWSIPVNDNVRVCEIHRPEDWAALVGSYPAEATGPHGGWGLPGSSQPLDSSGLLEIQGQRAAVGEMAAHMLPNWGAVATTFDAVHLSWAGFITAEGTVTVMGDGSCTMLRYWGSERTHWLRDSFGEPTPLDAPRLTGRINSDHGVSSYDKQRHAEDSATLSDLLGR